MEQEVKPSIGRRFVGFVQRYWSGSLAVVGVVLTIYIFWYQEWGKAGEIAFAVKGEGSVLTVQRQVPDLDVLYRGSSLLGTNKTLRFYSVQVINSGSNHILKGFFEDTVPWGFRLDGAEILQISNVEYKVSALANTRPELFEKNGVRLQPVNLDTGDWIQIDFLALTEATAQPKLTPMGRVSGTVLVVRNEIPTGSFFEQAFAGPALVQLARTVAYAVLLIIALIVLALSGFFVSSAISFIRSIPRRKRLRLSERGGAIVRPREFSAAAILREIYVEVGGARLGKIVALINDESRVRRMIERLNASAVTMMPGTPPRSTFAFVVMRLMDKEKELDPDELALVQSYGRNLIDALARYGDPEAAAVLSDAGSDRAVESLSESEELEALPDEMLIAAIHPSVIRPKNSEKMLARLDALQTDLTELKSIVPAVSQLISDSERTKTARMMGVEDSLLDFILRAPHEPKDKELADLWNAYVQHEERKAGSTLSRESLLSDHSKFWAIFGVEPPSIPPSERSVP